MKITYKLDKGDYLDFQLYTVSQSKRIQRKKIINWLVFALVSFAFGLYFYYDKNNSLAIYFGGIGIVWILFYKTYFKWKYKRHFIKYITDNYQNRFGKTVELTFNNDHIYSKEDAGEGSIKNSEVEHIAETNLYFYVKMLSGVSLIIPKNEINKLSELVQIFKSLNFEIVTKKDWNL